MKRALLHGHDEAVAAFVADRAPMEKPEWGEGVRGFGVLNENGALIAGVVFSNYRPEFQTIELSAASVVHSWLSPQIVAVLGQYAFGQPIETVNRVWARTALKNHTACRLLKHLGFKPEGDAVDYYGIGRHARTYRLLKREWMELRRHESPYREAA